MCTVFKKDDGSTLLETIIAVVLFAAVSAAGVAVLSGYTAGSRAISGADDFVSDVSMFHSLLTDDTGHFMARPIRAGGGGVDAAFSVQTDGKTILFHLVRRGLVAGPEGTGFISGLVLVEYHLTGDTLVRRVYDRADRYTETRYRDDIVLRGVRSVDLRYQKNAVWLSDWMPVAVDASAVPELLELRISFAEKGEISSIYSLAGGAV